MATADLLARWRLTHGPTPLKWPQQQMKDYGGWFLYALFVAIFVWEVRVRAGGRRASQKTCEWTDRAPLLGWAR